MFANLQKVKTRALFLRVDFALLWKILYYPAEWFQGKQHNHINVGGSFRAYAYCCLSRFTLMRLSRMPRTAENLAKIQYWCSFRHYYFNIWQDDCVCIHYDKWIRIAYEACYFNEIFSFFLEVICLELLRFQRW